MNKKMVIKFAVGVIAATCVNLFVDQVGQAVLPYEDRFAKKMTNAGEVILMALIDFKVMEYTDKLVDAGFFVAQKWKAL